VTILRDVCKQERTENFCRTLETERQTISYIELGGSGHKLLGEVLDDRQPYHLAISQSGHGMMPFYIRCMTTLVRHFEADPGVPVADLPDTGGFAELHECCCIPVHPFTESAPNFSGTTTGHNPSSVWQVTGPRGERHYCHCRSGSKRTHHDANAHGYTYGCTPYGSAM